VKIELGTLRLAAQQRGPIVISLEPGEFLRLEDEACVRLRCEEGRLWVTSEKDPADVWLGNGEHALLGGRGLTLIEAVCATRLRIGRP
jgi:hypothetical protein